MPTHHRVKRAVARPLFQRLAAASLCASLTLAASCRRPNPTDPTTDLTETEVTIPPTAASPAPGAAPSPAATPEPAPESSPAPAVTPEAAPSPQPSPAITTAPAAAPAAAPNASPGPQLPDTLVQEWEPQSAVLFEFGPMTVEAAAIQWDSGQTSPYQVISTADGSYLLQLDTAPSFFDIPHPYIKLIPKPDSGELSPQVDVAFYETEAQAQADDYVMFGSYFVE